MGLTVVGLPCRVSRFRAALLVALAVALGAAGALVVGELTGSRSRQPREVPPIELDVEGDDERAPDETGKPRRAGDRSPEKESKARSTRRGPSGSGPPGAGGGAQPVPPDPAPAGDDDAGDGAQPAPPEPAPAGDDDGDDDDDDEGDDDDDDDDGGDD